MSCPSCNCNPCQCNCSCDPANEAVSSALSNLQSNFLGSVTKQCVNGEVVWVLPCNLDTDFPNYPRREGEALLCYWQRVISILTQGGVTLCDALNQICALTLLPGDILYVNNSGAITKLSIGDEGDTLQVSSGLPVWTTSSGGAGGDFILLEEVATSGTQGGTSLATTWNQRMLNQVTVDTGTNVVQLFGGKFTLNAGTYRFIAMSQSINSLQAMMRLVNTTDATILFTGLSSYNPADGDGSTVSMTGRFTVAALKEIELDLYTTGGQVTSGLGQAFNVNPYDEKYAQIALWKE